MPRVRITNQTQAPQGFYATDLDAPMQPSLEGDVVGQAAVMIPVGGSARLDIDPEQLRIAKMLPGLSFENLAEAAAPAPAAALPAGADDGTRAHGAEALTPPRDNTAGGAPVTEPEKDQYDAMDDDALRAFITDRDGKPPHHRLSRENLLKAARDGKPEEEAV